jgi:hypothetical protein
MDNHPERRRWVDLDIDTVQKDKDGLESIYSSGKLKSNEFDLVFS